MKPERFDLNDIENEPTDEQLEKLMTAVADEAKRRVALAEEKLMRRLREEIVEVNRRWRA